MGNKKNKKILMLGTLLIVLLGVSFIIYTVTGANTGDNRIRISYAKMTSIKTGAGNFNNDGLDYNTGGSFSESYSKDSGYVAGSDSNDRNRIVRSFDTLVYNFDYLLEDKNESDDFDDRIVNVTVELTQDEAKYIAFDKNGTPGEASHTFTFEGASTYGMENASVTLYVLGAPNGTTISPKFTIKESTDQDNGVTLGKMNDNTNNYAFEDNRYKTTAEFINYMPTVVSSTEGTIDLRILSTTAEESQQAMYNNQVGRYITYVIGAKLNGNGESGIKGYTMPTGNISFDVNFVQTGNNTPIFNENWGRLYGEYKVDDINPIYVNIPYSTSHSNSSNKQIVNPGNLTVTSKGNGVYNISISDYSTLYAYPNVGADNNVIDSSDNYISSVALTTFSPRTTEDGKNDITVTLNTTGGVFTSTSGATNNIANQSVSNVNKYYENIDYSLVSGFYDSTGTTKLSIDTNLNGNVMKNGSGALSKGSNFVYKIDFNYNKTLSDQGLKEIVKIDDNAFRFMPFNDKDDYEIELKCGNGDCSSISKDDFEVKFVTGSFDSANYSLNDVNNLNLSEVEKGTVASRCSSIDLSSLNVNQIQNLYGGPCIKANTGIENEYEKIVKAKTEDGSEIPITKAIIQTKEGVNLPDNITVTVKFNLRVRNVTDITQTYQATVLARTSDYDNTLYYYAPGVDGEDSVCNPDNYIKTVYQGTSIVNGDTSLFGDSLKVVNFTSREEITVTNKNSDGTMKVNYNVMDNDTITYNVKTIIEDYNEAVGADDVWYINSLYIQIILPSDLEYIPDADLIQPLHFYEGPDYSTLEYSLPYTKPNMKIPEINFRAKIKPTLSSGSSAKPLTVTSHVYAQNINNETDTSLFGLLTGDFTIYATGLNTVIVGQEVGANGTVVEKNEQINYILKAYNNTPENISDYSIIDVLPYSGDDNGSNINGSYSVKVTMPDSLANAKVYCSKATPSSIKQEPLNENNEWEECNVTEEFTNKVTAIKIDNISINSASYMDNILVTLKPSGNKYSNVYANNFVGANKTHAATTSNTIKVKVVSRKISGRVFIDVSGNGVKDGNETYVAGIPVTLKVLRDGNETETIAETTTDKDGYYEFKDLDKGRYKLLLEYDSSKYDLTLRYATEDTSKDSDAYKVDDSGKAAISNKRIPDDPNGIRLTKDVTNVSDMDMGLIARQSFGFTMKKYITKIDLTYNGTVSTTEYDNQSSVPITVRNSWNATAKVYYGIAITNNSTKAGYVNLIQEDIPQGMIFDSSYPENQDWFEVNGVLQTNSLTEDLIQPGETRYLQISLFMPKREEAGTFLNTVSIIESTMYDPEALAEDNEYSNNDKFIIGDALTYAGVNWHVIGVTTNEDNSQNLTLLADSGTISDKKSHTNSSNETYSWGQSMIKGFINYSWSNSNTLNTPILYDQVVCDDASGLEAGSYGGTMNGRCQSNMYTTSKVRLLTLDEYTSLTTSSLSDLSWLYGSNDFWLQNTDYISPEYLETYKNAYNNSFANKEHTETYEDVSYGIQQNSVYNQAMYIGRSGSNYVNLIDNASAKKEVRPVITISTNNIVAE